MKHNMPLALSMIQMIFAATSATAFLQIPAQNPATNLRTSTIPAPYTKGLLRSYSNDNDNDNDNNDRQIQSDLISLSLPTLATLSIDPLLSFTDTYFASYADSLQAFSVDNLASVATAAPAVNFVLFLFNGVLGTSVVPSVVSRERGSLLSSSSSSSSDLPPSNSAQLTLRISFQSGLIIALAALPILYLLPNPQITLLPQLLPILTVRALTLPFTFSLTTSLSILRGYLDTKTPFKVLAGLGVLNLTLSYALTHYFSSSISGGLAVISATCLCEILGSYLIYRNLLSASILPPSFPFSPAPKTDGVINSVVKRGTSSSFVRSFLLQSFILSIAYVTSHSSGDPAAISSHQVACLIWFLSSFAVDAIGSAAQTMVAEEIGREGDPKFTADKALQLGVKAGLMLSLLTGGFCYGLGGVEALTHGNAAVMEGVASVLPVVVLCQPLNGAVFVADGVLQGANEFDFEAKAMAVSVLLATAFIALAESQGWQGTTLQHVWEGLALLQVSRGAIALARIKGIGFVQSCFI
ncbi:hypothetical protein TrVE_jg5531 [Triparma verrucosa]|uniref:Protein DETOXIFICATION n=1 Tax=Triparma verrucosa TaxID=1606542 RepID=A0A9W7BPX1_9STRA|nr:hypothetical protein TrVE_jg5531 [Triparma verrucosa]